MHDLNISFEDLSKQEVHHLLECLAQETPTTSLDSFEVSSQQIDYAGVRRQLSDLARLSPDYQEKMTKWLYTFQQKSAERIVIADLGPNETTVIITGMFLLVAALHAITMKRITQESGKTVEEYYSLPAELGKMFKSIPVGLVEAIQKIMGKPGEKI